MWGHARRCAFREDGSSNQNLTDHCKMILFANQESGKVSLEEFDVVVVPDMRKDSITSVVRNDEIIIGNGSVWQGMKNC